MGSAERDEVDRRAHERESIDIVGAHVEPACASDVADGLGGERAREHLGHEGEHLAGVAVPEHEDASAADLVVRREHAEEPERRLDAPEVVILRRPCERRAGDASRIAGRSVVDPALEEVRVLRIELPEVTEQPIDGRARHLAERIGDGHGRLRGQHALDRADGRERIVPGERPVYEHDGRDVRRPQASPDVAHAALPRVGLARRDGVEGHARERRQGREGGLRLGHQKRRSAPHVPDDDPDHERDDNRENREHPHLLAPTTHRVIAMTQNVREKFRGRATPNFRGKFLLGAWV